MTRAANASRLFVPPFPPRAEKPRGALSTILTLRRNPLEIWGKAAFEQPFWVGRSSFGMRAMAHDPAAVRHVLLDNAANYRKDELQLRILSPGLGDGVLTAEGESWRAQRRALAPLFSPREVVGFAAVDAESRRRSRRAPSAPARWRGGGSRRSLMARLELGSPGGDPVFARARTGAERFPSSVDAPISTPSAASIPSTCWALPPSCRDLAGCADARRSSSSRSGRRDH